MNKNKYRVTCDVCTRVDGQNDPSPRSTSPLDGDLSSHHQATKSPGSTDQLSPAGIRKLHLCVFLQCWNRKLMWVPIYNIFISSM